MLLTFENGNLFAQGASEYGYRPVTEREDTPRIFVNVKIESITTEAVVDTGGVYLICNPEIADLLKPNRSDALKCLKVKTSRWGDLTGTLHRLYLTLLADEGESLTLDVTAFMPCPDRNELHDIPNIMGCLGCLERTRFAVDPIADMFYFGSIDEGN